MFPLHTNSCPPYARGNSERSERKGDIYKYKLHKRPPLQACSPAEAPVRETAVWGNSEHSELKGDI